MIEAVQQLGINSINFTRSFGALCIFIGKTVAGFFKSPFYLGSIGRQLLIIGYGPKR